MSTDTINLSPRFAEGGHMRVIGLMETYTGETMDQAPRQWRHLQDRLGDVTGQVDPAQFGIGYDAGQSPFRVDYLTGIMVSDDAPLPDGFVERRITPNRHAVFTHEGHVSGLRRLFDAIYREWLPGSGQELVGEPLFVEVYGESFDGRTGEGTIEIWIPIKR